MEPNSEPANPAPAAEPTAAPATPVAMPENPNELSTEMTEEQEQAFVNATLGIKGVPSEPTKAPDPTPSPAEPEKPVVAPTPEPATPETPPVTPPVAPEAEPPVPPTPPAAEEPAAQPAAELTTPQTDDLWIEVDKVSQDKDGNPISEKVKLVYDPANPNSFLPENFTFKDDAQLFSILDAKTEMANLYKERLAKYESDRETVEEAETATKTEAEVKAGWDSEIQDLIDGKLLEAPKVKAGEKGFEEDPTVQKVKAVFDFMVDENKARNADGRPPLRSFGTAFNLYNNNEEVKAAEVKQKQDNDLAKARGALVGGTSAPVTTSETPVYKRGSASNIWQVKVPE